MKFSFFKIDKILTAIYFALIYLYIWLRIDPALYFQSQEPIFILDSRFFNDFISYPGGIVDLLAAFLSQFYYYPWLGALIITVIIWLICSLAKSILESLTSANEIKFVHFIPAILLLMMHSLYVHPLSVTLGLLIALVFANLYLLLIRRSIITRLIAYVSFAIILYYTACGQIFLFSLMCGLFEVATDNSWWKKILFFSLFIIIALLIPYFSYQTFIIISLDDAFLHSLPLDLQYNPWYSSYLLYIVFPLAFVFRLIRIVILKDRNWTDILRLPSFVKKIGNIFSGKLQIILFALLLLLLTGYAAYISFDKDRKTFLLIEYYAQRHEWKQVLETANELQTLSLPMSCQVNRALFHCGMMPDKLLSYPQAGGVDGLMLPRKLALANPALVSEIYFELGLLNAAQHWAHESMTHWGQTMWNLQRLVRINLLNGRKHFAQNCLNVLNKMIIEKDWTEKYQRYLNNPELVSADDELNQIQLQNVDSDFVMFTTNNPPIEFKALLEKSKTNKMAFEYLMSYYLLKRRMLLFIMNLPRINELDYSYIPRIYEEALLFHVALTKQQNINLGGKKIDPATVQDFQSYYRVLAKNNGNKAAAQEELKRDFGNTYWYYLMFGKKPDNTRDDEN